MKDLKDKIVLITGAACGIGRETAIEFAQHGADIILADIDVPGMQDTASVIRSFDREALQIRTDVSNEKDVESLVKQSIDRFGRVDILMNNAGVGMNAEIRDMSIPEWEWILGINLWGAIYTLHYLLPYMVKQGSGHIVNVSSAVGLVSFVPIQAAYTTSKFALVGLSDVLRTEMERFGIGVTAICPGSVNTAFFKTTKYKGFKRGAMDDLPGFLFADPKIIAKKIVRAVKKNRSVVVISAVAKFAYYLKRISPALAQQLSRMNMKLFLKYKIED